MVMFANEFSFFNILFISMFTCIQWFKSGIFYSRITSTTRILKAAVIEKPDSSSISSVDDISPLYISSSGPGKVLFLVTK